MCSRLGVTGFALSTLVFSSQAFASTELPLRFGARSLAMGGTGVAFMDDATSIAVNPARLDRIPKFAATATMAPFMPRNEVPFSDDRRQKGERNVIPLFFLGAGARVLEPLTVGAAVYAAAGAGAEYEGLPEFDGLDMSLEVGVIEAAIPVAYRVSDELSLGVALRGAFCFLSTDMPIDIGGTGGPLRLEQSLSGFGAPGVLVGISWHPTDTVAFGATYRSKMTIDLEGDGTATHSFLGENPVAIESRFATAHVIRFGTAVSLLDQKLLVAFEVSHALLSDAYEVLPLSIDFTERPDTQLEQEVVLGWRDSQSASLGIEYDLSEVWAIRTGYQLTRSGTPNETASPLAPPPGTIHGFHGGLGLTLDRTRIDLGGAYAFGGADVTRSENGPAGRYDGDYILLAGSVSYRM